MPIDNDSSNGSDCPDNEYFIREKPITGEPAHCDNA